MFPYSFFAAEFFNKLVNLVCAKNLGISKDFLVQGPWVYDDLRHVGSNIWQVRICYRDRSITRANVYGFYDHVLRST